MKVVLRVLVIVLSLAMAGGCAHLGKVDKAAESFQKAEELGAEQKAPYEYYAAKAYLDMARHEVEDSDRKQAGIFAEKSMSFAEQAISKSGGAK
jgi:hypothetical protein